MIATLLRAQSKPGFNRWAFRRPVLVEVGMMAVLGWDINRLLGLACSTDYK